MSNAAQIAANQKNATRSTGPRTPEGKSASAANSTRHGLTGNFRLLPGEDPDEYAGLLASYQQDFEPATEHENFLVAQLTESRWKLQRIERLQAEAFDRMLAKGNPEDSSDARIIAKLSQETCVLDRLQRYAAQAERTYHRAARELNQLHRQRTKQDAAARSAQIDRLMTGPLPNHPQYGAYRDLLRNEAKPAPATPTIDDRALRL